jgi:hypothetical protein
MYYLGFNFESDRLTIKRFSLYSEENGMKYENFDNFMHAFKTSKRKLYLYRDMVIMIDKSKFQYFLEKIKDENFAVKKKYNLFLMQNDLSEHAV